MFPRYAVEPTLCYNLLAKTRRISQRTLWWLWLAIGIIVDLFFCCYCTSLAGIPDGHLIFVLYRCLVCLAKTCRQRGPKSLPCAVKLSAATNLCRLSMVKSAAWPISMCLEPRTVSFSMGSRSSSPSRHHQKHANYYVEYHKTRER